MSKNFLQHIHTPSDLRKLKRKELPIVAQELRNFIIDIVATKEGHLGASLGVVELTIALHYFFDTPNDLLVWDVGHQAYGHKIITGRKDIFHTNRQLGGIAGFPVRKESEFDAFGVGHSSTSISAVLGMAIASKIKKENKHHIAVIGDASIASGMAFEALNHAGVSDTNILVILNDNAIGIDPAVGALKDYLTRIKKDKHSTEENIFKALQFNYSGPIDGNNIDALLNAFENLNDVKGPKLLHVITTKGKGLEKAEQDQITYHAPGKFDKISGERLLSKASEFTKFQDVFGKTIVELASKNNKIVAITPAMVTGSSLNLMMEKYPERTFDVGIAEQHAVTFAAGLATQGLRPFCVIYSTFLQRAYDQVIHDVALQNLPVIFCIDRAGLVGEDGATHHGIFDIAYLRCIPNLIVYAPKDEISLRNMLYTAQLGLQHPIAIRYPRGFGNLKNWEIPFEKIDIGKGKCLQKGNKKAILCCGTIYTQVVKAMELISNRHYFSIYDFGFVKPLDTNLLDEIFAFNYEQIFTIEDGVISGGFGTAILEYANSRKYQNPIQVLGFEDKFIEHGSVNELLKLNQLDFESLKVIFDSF